jgi:type IX secretion system PorP/SprF family membrane protein
VQIKRFTFLLLTLLLAGFQQLVAQQEPQFTHNMFNHDFVNPGSYGLSEGITVTGIYREQWIGLTDNQNKKIAPQTFLLSADAPVKFLHGGLGLSLVQDKESNVSNMLVRVGYAFHLNVGNGRLGIGINANLNNKLIKTDGFIPVDESDPVLSAISGDATMISDVAAGIFLKKPRYYIALSSTQILETGKQGGTDGMIPFKNRRHYYFTTGYDLIIPAYQGMVFTPSVFLKSDGNTIQADLNIIGKYNNAVWGGIGYRLRDAASLMGGVIYKDIEIGMAYDIPTSRIAAAGSVEIMARYRFKLEREKERSGYHNTRYL